MARSRIGEDQIKDIDLLTEDEHESVEHYFEDLVDTTTLSGNRGKYLKVDDDSDIIVYSTITGTGGGASTLVELTDTPGSYDYGKFLKSTSDGTVWATVSGSVGSSEVTEIIELIADVNFDTRQVKKTTIGIEEGIITSYSGGTWEDY